MTAIDKNPRSEFVFELIVLLNSEILGVDGKNLKKSVLYYTVSNVIKLSARIISAAARRTARISKVVMLEPKTIFKFHDLPVNSARQSFQTLVPFVIEARFALSLGTNINCARLTKMRRHVASAASDESQMRMRAFREMHSALCRLFLDVLADSVLACAIREDAASAGGVCEVVEPVIDSFFS